MGFLWAEDFLPHWQLKGASFFSLAGSSAALCHVKEPLSASAGWVGGATEKRLPGASPDRRVVNRPFD